ncbi:hypothetical protein DUNSADRAFT_10445 [Dunaliella salina]|uniref:Uncharacterized protein n=1 Tax=Dunaliella salina TaxID=3046 RepID=A0ABQ7FS95_DUNSA|nr:hypothetical protein DUNSADRAFT_10445 [Dunaliella salina]|eukprot:KAF5825410.1 hypothetical protein DUNSADRAFT_10445 [Dunaliella salina]
MLSRSNALENVQSFPQFVESLKRSRASLPLEEQQLFACVLVGWLKHEGARRIGRGKGSANTKSVHTSKL